MLSTKKIGLYGKIFFLWAFVPGLLWFGYSCEKRRIIEPAVGINVSRDYWVKVLLFDNLIQCSLARQTGFAVTDNISDATAAFERSQDAIQVRVVDNRILVGEHLFGPDITITPENPFVISIDGNKYRGNLNLTISDTADSFDVINELPIESYLAGVVGAEMPGYWEPEALKAQAVASRTYCLFIKKQFGTRRNWDVKRTQAHQVYKGLAAETSTIWQAVADTYGQVLVCRGNDGISNIFPTYYSSACGGHTENSQNVFGDSYEPLYGVRCPYCREIAKMTVFYWQMVSFDAKQLSSLLIRRYPNLAALEEIVDIVPCKVSEYGAFSRITSFKLLGSTGKIDYLRSEDLRLTANPSGTKIRSTSCKILKYQNRFIFYSGMGYGHGVGMCQCGAQGMARQGSDYTRILEYYYPGSLIVRKY